MTPAIVAATQAGIRFTVHPYEHNPTADSYGEEAARALGLDPDRVLKTLVTALDDGQLAVAILPVSKRLDLKAFAVAAGTKKVSMADGKDAERVTGYVIGGISPLGQKKPLPAILDASALKYDTIYVSGGKRGLQIELAPDDLRIMIGANVASISRK